MAPSNGISDFEIMGTSSTNINIPKKIASSVSSKIRKLTLTKSRTNTGKQNRVRLTRQGWHTMRKSHS